MYQHRKLLNIVTLIDDGTLINDAATIESLIYKVGCSAKNLNAILHSILNGVRTLKRGKQRGVDIYDTLLVTLKKHLTHNAHIAGKTDVVHTALIEHRSEERLVGLARLIVLGVEGKALCSIARSTLKNLCTGLIADQEYNLGIDTSVATRLDNSLVVTAAATCEYRQSRLFHTPYRIVTPSPSTTLPMIEAFSPSASRIAIARSVSF